jgi:hypothetical protein
MQVARVVQQGSSWEEAVRLAEHLSLRSTILVSVPSLKYMVRGGRVSPLKGLAARILNLKPIVSLDKEGKSSLSGKAFSTRSNLNKIIRRVCEIQENTGIAAYAVGHAHAPEKGAKLAEDISKAIGKKADYVVDIAPVIGVHAGIGAVSVSVLEIYSGQNGGEK